jgi:hypothetical protein
MLSDRLVGVLCLGLAALAATWDGDVTWPAARRARPMATARPASHRDAADAAFEASAGTAAGGTTGPPPTRTAAAPTTTASGSTTTTATGPPGPGSEAARAIARQALVVQGDLPSGFVVLRPAPADEQPTTDGPLERCLGADAGQLTAAIGAKAGSAQFGKGGTGTVSSSSAVFDQIASAQRALDVLSSPSARSCFEGLINARLARNPNLPEDVRGSLSSLEVERVGDQTTGYRFEVKLPAEDVEDDPKPSEGQISYLADFVFLRRGRVLALVEMASLRQPFDSGVAGDLLSSLVQHMPPA